MSIQDLILTIQNKANILAQHVQYFLNRPKSAKNEVL